MPDASDYKGPKVTPPDYDMSFPGQLNEEEKKKILAWFEEKLSTAIRGFPKCEMCGTNQWRLEQHTVTPIIFGRALQIGGTVYPQVMLSCVHCGNVKYFAAKPMGILKKEDK
jgi:hypothetical protein